jgi:hypothetical protein
MFIHRDSDRIAIRAHRDVRQRAPLPGFDVLAPAAQSQERTQRQQQSDFGLHIRII